MTAYALYTSPGCKEEGEAVPDTFLNASIPILTGEVYNASNSGDGVRAQNLRVTVLPELISTSDIYNETTAEDGNITAQIEFCVRFSLQTAGAVEVNFLETLVTLFVELSDGFEIGQVNVAPKIQLLNTANQVYLLDGYQCDGDNGAINGTALVRNQGSVIRVCVKPDSEAVTAGIKMRSLDKFTFARGDTTQEAISGSNQQAANGLTSLICSNGVAVCTFETILFAAFYTTDGEVLGSGTGSMQFGPARRLRALADEAATSDFELDFRVNAVDIQRGDDSGAATSGVMAATALVMAGALALIY
jgi:hypothetical protein